MEVTFEDSSLEELEKQDRKTRLSKDVVKAYRKAMNFLRNMTDERDLAFPGLRVEKLKGDLAGLRSARLNDQWRLIFDIKKGSHKNIIHIISIRDYH